jgi:hypothetical protein
VGSSADTQDTPSINKLAATVDRDHGGREVRLSLVAQKNGSATTGAHDSVIAAHSTDPRRDATEPIGNAFDPRFVLDIRRSEDPVTSVANRRRDG